MQVKNEIQSAEMAQGISYLLLRKGFLVMNDSKKQKNSLYEDVPAMAAINRVPGFDPQKFLRMVAKENGEKSWKLDLGYMRAWFRMSRPNGRLRFKPLRITEQLAIFEAQVFLDRNDAEPFSNFTAQCTLEEADDGDYVKAAQDAALAVALTDAGFGIQFVDLLHDEKGEVYGSEVPVSGQKKVPEVKKQSCATAALVSTVSERNTARNDTTGNTAMKNTVAEKQTESTVVLEKTATITNFQKKESLIEQLPVQVSGQTEEEKLPVQLSEQMVNENLPVQIMKQVVKESLQPSQKQVSYTADMPVEEILKQMTFEEAQTVVVDMGVCNGWTMAEVAERRAPSLKFYVYGGYRGNNNIIRAAAKIMLDSLTGEKAS